MILAKKASESYETHKVRFFWPESVGVAIPINIFRGGLFRRYLDQVVIEFLWGDTVEFEKIEGVEG